MYSEKVMDHFNNPRNVGEIENPSGVATAAPQPKVLNFASWMMPLSSISRYIRSMSPLYEDFVRKNG